MTTMRYPQAMAAIIITLAASTTFASEQDYQQWKSSTQKAFNQYLSEQDKAFLSFLNKPWQTVDTDQQAPPDQAPKPDSVPVATPVTEPSAQPPVEPATPVTAVKPVTPKPIKPKPVKPRPAKPLPPSGEPRAEFDFYGKRLAIAWPQRVNTQFRARLNGDAISAFWQRLAGSNWQATLKDIRHHQQQLQLNDWAVVMLIQQLSQSHADVRSQPLLSWFLLLQAGFDARVAYDAQQAYVLLASDEPIFGETFFQLDGRAYYALLRQQQGKIGRLTTYDGQHADSTQALSFEGLGQLQLDGDMRQRQLKVVLNDRNVELKLDYSQAYVDFLDSVPQLNLQRYFSVGLPAVSEHSLRQQFQPLLQGLDQQQAVNRLLYIVQNALSYQTDDQQFGYENYLFPLETLHYPYADCEDRAALFAHLVESLLGLKVIITDYPGHVATAVALDGDASGDRVHFQGRDYWIADPTYINARLGMTMPQLAKVKPKLSQP
jgi:hypothetical protein